MRGRFIVVLAAVAALGVLAPSAASNAACGSATIDSAALLTTSTRLDGAVESLRREGVDTIVRTVPSGLPRDHATALAARCPDLTSPDTDAVIVVITPAGAAELLAIGHTTPTEATLAEKTIRERLDAGDPDTTSALAEGLETLWQARTLSDRFDGGRPRSPNVWAAARQRRLAGMAIAVGAAVAVAGLAGLSVLRRRQVLAAHIAEAQDRRTALAVAYLDLDAAVVRATQQSASGALPISATAAVSAAAERAGAALLATADAKPTRASEARALATTCATAEHDLRSAVAAIEAAGARASNVTPVGFGVQAHERTGAH